MPPRTLSPPPVPFVPFDERDARGRRIRLPTRPHRLVSLVPSLTELLAALDLDEEVVGVTRFCVRPEDWKATRTVVGGTKNVNLDRVASLEPDLVLANLEENTREAVEALDASFPVYVTDVTTLDDALAMIRTVGRMVGRAGRGERMAARIREGFEGLPTWPPVRAAYLIWREPYMAAGGDTFIHDVMRWGGLENVFGRRRRYPEVTPAELARAAPSVVLLSSEPYPFAERHLRELAPRLPGTALHLVDGEPFSWYGSRLLATPAYLRRLRAGL